jgi:hypothetical protein
VAEFPQLTRRKEHPKRRPEARADLLRDHEAIIRTRRVEQHPDMGMNDFLTG